MRWSGDRNAGFSTADELCRPLNEADPASVEAQRRDPESFLNWMERLIRRRKECPEIGWGTFEVLDTGNSAVLASRSDWEERTVVAVHNLAGEPAEVELNLDGKSLVDLLGTNDAQVSGGVARLSLGRYGHAWYHLQP
jgi:maltose alpha-D-glucosyltransferase/alpha-amylase